MKSCIQTKTQLTTTLAVVIAAFGLSTGANAQNQIVMNDNVNLNGIQSSNLTVLAGSGVSGYFDCIVYSDANSTNCHTLIVGFRDGSNRWAGGQPVCAVQTTALPTGLSLNNLAFDTIEAPLLPGTTYYLWVDDYLPSPTCPSIAAAISAFTTSQPSEENDLQRRFAVVATLPVLATPKPIAPTCGGIVGTATPVLSWSGVAGAGDYVVNVYAGGSCAGQAVVDSFSGGAASYPVPASAGLQFGQTYSWRVWAVPSSGSGYTASSGSACCSFNVVQPALSAMLSGTNMVISYATNTGISYTLQSADTLGASWNPVGTVPAISNDNYQVTLPLTGSAQFYQLGK